MANILLSRFIDGAHAAINLALHAELVIAAALVLVILAMCIFRGFND